MCIYLRHVRVPFGVLNDLSVTAGALVGGGGLQEIHPVYTKLYGIIWVCLDLHRFAQICTDLHRFIHIYIGFINNVHISNACTGASWRFE